VKKLTANQKTTLAQAAFLIGVVSIAEISLWGYPVLVLISTGLTAAVANVGTILLLHVVFGVPGACFIMSFFWKDLSATLREFFRDFEKQGE
jgi:hypothetical protein